MPGLNVISGNAFASGLNLEVIDTYRQRKPGPDSAITRNMRIDVPSKKRTEDYFFWENSPLIRRWLAGTLPAFGTFKGIKFSVENLDWKTGVSWLRQDRRDDLTGQLVPQAQTMGVSAALLDEDVFYQINGNTVDDRLLENIPLSPDGVALHNAVDGDGNDRFGVSGGNIIGGGTVATGALIRTDFFKGTRQARRFQNTKGQQLLTSGMIESVTVHAAAENEQVFREAFQQVRVQGTAAAPTNIVQDAGYNVNLQLTQKLTGDDWYMYFDRVDPKPIFSQLREALREIMITEDNSQESAQTGQESLMIELAKAFGIFTPFGTVKINN